MTEVSADKITIEIAGGVIQKSKVLNLRQIEKIEIERYTIAIRLDEVGEEKFAYITLASLGETQDIGESDEAVDSVFESVENEGTIVESKRLLMEPISKQTQVKILFYVIIGLIVLILIFLVYKFIEVSKDQKKKF